MAFLTPDDYTAQIKGVNLDAIVASDTTALATAESSAVAQVKDYLFERYDTDAIFSATGTDRHAYLVTLVVNIVLYQLFKRLPKHISSNKQEQIVKDYNDTLDYLDKVVDGRMSADLPRKLSAQGAALTKFRCGSQPKRSH